MNATKTTEQSQDSHRQCDLDNRYGKIGISAVAAALCHQGERHNTNESHLTPYERD